MDPGKSFSAGPSSASPTGSDEEREIVWEIKPDLFGKEDESEDSEDEKSTGYGKKKQRGVPEGMIIVNPHMCGSSFAIDDPLVINPNVVYYVMVDGYYRKGRGLGGYGAVLRCKSCQPISALSGVSEKPISGLYHLLEGMLAGFRLVHDKNVRYVVMSCNSDWAYWMVEQCYNFYGQKECRRHPNGEFDIFCIPCLQSTMEVYGDDFTRNCKIIKDIVLFRHQNFRGSMLVSGNRCCNQGADFMAKFLKGPGPKERIFEPDEFPKPLEEILKDAGFPYLC